MPIREQRMIQRLDRLALIGKTPDGGVTRMSFTPQYWEAEALVAEWMREAGLVTHRDAVGNLIGHLQGRNLEAPTIVMGSHIDTVVNGGRFDGTVGVVGGIEVAHSMQELGVQLNHHLEVVVFVEEEGTRWGRGCLGSRAMLGLLPDDVLEYQDRQGVTIAEAMMASGLDPEGIHEARRDSERIAVYLEMHIEQGAVLDSLNYPVGVVTAIAAPVMLSLRVKGKSDHAGATPMLLRRDALVAGARLVLAAEQIAKETSPTCVATVGRLEVSPGTRNTIPGEVFMTFDLRDIDLRKRDKMEKGIVMVIEKVAADCRVEYKLEETSRFEPVLLPRWIVDLIAASCQRAGVPVYKLPSGAGHDAYIMARMVDTGMVFLRSKDGVSHCPEEFTAGRDITLGSEVLYHTVMALDRQERGYATSASVQSTQ